MRFSLELLRTELLTQDFYMPPGALRRFWQPTGWVGGLLILVVGIVAAADPVPWSLRPLNPPRVPAAADAGWSRNPLDRFIFAQLTENKLVPAAAADRRTLLRRLALDLTGLPPSPEVVAAFIDDPHPDAYEKQVDALLNSPRHGEHWARHWLDLASYADTHGNDHDFIRPHAWPYRDYVIQSLNQDKPYSRFVQEQVAGDVLFPEDPAATVALGFLAASPWDHTLMVTVREDTVDHRLAQVLDRDNMVTSVMSTFQSLTVHCARCHNHKFDPISQREYYALQAVFAGVDRADRPYDAEPATHRRRGELRSEQQRIAERAPSVMARLAEPATQRRVADYAAEVAKRERAWSPLEVMSVVSTGGANLSRESDGSWFVSGVRPARDTYIVTARWRAGALRALRLETLPDARLPQHGPGRFDNGHFHLTEFRAFLAPAGSRTNASPLKFARASADQNEGPGMSAAQAIDGNDATHWGIHPHYGVPHEAVFELAEATEVTADTTVTILLEHLGTATGHGIGRFRLSASDAIGTADSLVPPPAEIVRRLRIPPDQRTADDARDLALAVLAEDNARALAALPPAQSVYAVTRDFPVDGNFKPPTGPRPIQLLKRGDLHQPGELVGPGTIGCLPGLSGELTVVDPADESQRRAALARWLTDERNVLTWRSVVNRVWHYHFGRGLCDTPSDFGRMGGLPSHPELLDWLAVWFRDEAHGSLKALHKLIVTSAAYQQSSQASPAAQALDPENRLLSHMNRPRLSAEELRDAVLQLSGRLDLTMGGPSVVQFGDKGDATFNPGGNPAYLDYEHFDPDAPAHRRRAVYRFLFRTVADPFMDALDCPDGGAGIAVRGVSTTALQAFALLNDAFLIRQSEHLAARIVPPGTGPMAAADAAFRHILLRAPKDAERAQMASYIQRHGLANACHLLLNSNEFLYVD